MSEDEVLARLLDEGGDLPFAVSAYGSEPDQVLETVGPEGAPTLVVVHGGYFRPSIDRTHARPMARALAEEGWRVVLAEYRRVPGAPFVTVADLAALDAHLEGSGHRVAAWVGHSAGGTLALWRALTPDLPPVPVVALAPVADLDAAVAAGLGDGAVADWVGDADPRDVDPRRLLTANPAAAERIRLVHGDRDETVPLNQSTALGAPLTVLRGAHHFDLVDPASTHWPDVVDAIRTRSRSAPRRAPGRR